MSDARSESGRCQAHGGISDELRVLAEMLADRVQPWLERMAQPPPSARQQERAAECAQHGCTAGSSPCASCPVCALIVVLRGERPELVSRFAEHTAALVALTRELLKQPASQDPKTGEATPRSSSPGSSGSSSPASPPSSAAPPSGRRAVQHVTVQHITVQHVSSRTAAARPASPGQGGVVGC